MEGSQRWAWADHLTLDGRYETGTDAEVNVQELNRNLVDIMSEI